MKRKLMLTFAYSALFVLAASGQDTRQTIAKFNESNAYALKGQQLSGANKPEEALKAFQQAAQLNPDNQAAVAGQYTSLVQLKRVNEAAKIMDDYVATKPGDPGRWGLRAMVEFETDQPEELLKSLAKLVELQPNDWGTWLFRGKILASLERYDDAIKSYDKVVELGEDAFFDRACAYAEKGDKTNALADLKTAIQRSSSFKAEAAKEYLFSSLRDDPDFKKLLESEPDPLALIPSKPKILSARDMNRLMGQWVGKLDGPVVYTIILRFEKTKDGKFISVTDCPEQGLYGNALTEAFVDGDQVTWKLPLIWGYGSYIGIIKGNTITGTWTIGRMDVALNVTKGAAKPKPIVTQMKIPPDAMKNLLGRWKGPRGDPGPDPEVIFRFERNAGKDAVFVDIPVKNAKGIPVITASLIDDFLSLRIAGAEYHGILNGNKIEGAYRPTGQGDNIPFTLTKE
jgi:tetratricopeptide (TPR) repeat protein